MNCKHIAIVLLIVMITPLWGLFSVMGLSGETDLYQSNDGLVQFGSFTLGDSVKIHPRFTRAKDTVENQIPPPIFSVDSLREHAQFSPNLPVKRGYLDSLFSILTAVYNATNGQDWSYQECPDHSVHWDITKMPPSITVLDQWCGLTFFKGKLTGINLQKNNMTGSLPSELTDLVDLTFLDLGQNELTGTIPHGLSNLKNLAHLSFFKNQMTGTIPVELSALEQLNSLSLGENQLTGVIPPELGNLKQLVSLRLANNQLTGSIPVELTTLGQLGSLSLWGNPLTGTIPPEIGNLTQLGELQIGSVEMSGPLPPVLNNLTRLKQLRIWYMPLTKADITLLATLQQLEELDLYNNQVEGEILAEIGNLSSLRELVWESSKLTGSIPSELGNLANLESLDLSNNQLTGEIPPELGNLANLESLDLFNNQLTGEIPPELGNLVNIESLFLGSNQLTGPIPPELGRLQNVDVIQLSSNALTGSIPRELGNLNLGKILDDRLIIPRINLARNQLTGAIPSTLGNLEHLQALNLSGNNLTHTIPSTLGNLANLIILRLSNNQLTGALPKSLTQIKTLQSLRFDENSGLCSPPNQAFQTWLSTIFNVNGGICTVVSLPDEIENQSYPRTHPIAPLILPTSSKGVPPIQYTLNLLDLPSGLQYNASTRTISGTPTQVTPPVRFTYKATDAIQIQDSLQFTIEVYSPVATQHEALPEKFDLQANYPNPFQHTTHLVMDLPWTAQIQVEVMDVMGRRVMMLPAVDIDAGWEQTIEIDGTQLPSGLYMYRLIVQSPTDRSAQVGHFTRVR